MHEELAGILVEDVELRDDTWVQCEFYLFEKAIVLLMHNFSQILCESVGIRLQAYDICLAVFRLLLGLPHLMLL